VPRNRLSSVMKHYSPTGRRNHGRPLKRLLDTWDWHESTSGPTPWKIYDDDGDTVFSNTLNLPSSLNVRNQVSHPLKTRGKWLDKYAQRCQCVLIASKN
jgi:hypothetical protein